MCDTKSCRQQVVAQAGEPAAVSGGFVLAPCSCGTFFLSWAGNLAACPLHLTVKHRNCLTALMHAVAEATMLLPAYVQA